MTEPVPTPVGQPRARGRTDQGPRHPGILALGGLAANDFKRDFDVVARGMGIGADLFMRFPNKSGELCLDDALVLDVYLHREAETAALARTYAHGASHLGLGRVFLLRLGNEIECAAEAGGIAG